MFMRAHMSFIAGYMSVAGILDIAVQIEKIVIIVAVLVIVIIVKILRDRRVRATRRCSRWPMRLSLIPSATCPDQCSNLWPTWVTAMKLAEIANAIYSVTYDATCPLMSSPTKLRVCGDCLWELRNALIIWFYLTRCSVCFVPIA